MWESLRPMLPKPSQWLPDWQPCAQASGDLALPLQMPFCRGWVGGQIHGPLQCPGSVASATVRFFSLHTSLMAMLHFSQKELRKAFSDFSKISRSNPRNPRQNPRSTTVQKDFILYAIYAVECGLKCILLAKHDVRSTSDLAKEDFTHDLNLLLGKSEVADRSSKLFQRMKRCGKNIPSKQLHELYRYGGQLDTRSENNLIEDLSDLFVKIKDELEQSTVGQHQQ